MQLKHASLSLRYNSMFADILLTKQFIEKSIDD